MQSTVALAQSVAAKISSPSTREDLVRETRRIAEGQRGSPQLDGDLLVLAGLIVHVCVIVVELAGVVVGFSEMKKKDQLAEVLKLLAQRSGDSDAASDPKVNDVASAAIDIVNNGEPKK